MDGIRHEGEHHGEHAGPPSHHHPAAGHHVAEPPPHLSVIDPFAASEQEGSRAVAVAWAVAIAFLVAAIAAWAVALVHAPAAADATSASSALAGRASAFPSSSTDPSVAPGAPTAALLPASSPTLVLGDSLALTVYPWLADLLPDRYVSYEAGVGRSSAQIATALEAMSSVPNMVLVSAGTNDSSVTGLQDSVQRILTALGPQRCVVWVDIVRPDSSYATAAELNAGLEQAVAGHANVSVLRWSELVAAHPDWMSGDGIHPNQTGAKARADAFAAAALACSPLDPSAPTARKQYLDSSVFWGPLKGQGSSGSGSGSGNSGGQNPGVTLPPTTGTGSGSSTSATPAASASASASASTTAPAPPPPTVSPTAAPTSAPPTKAPTSAPASTPPPASTPTAPPATASAAGASPSG